MEERAKSCTRERVFLEHFLKAAWVCALFAQTSFARMHFYIKSHKVHLFFSARAFGAREILFFRLCGEARAKPHDCERYFSLLANRCTKTKFLKCSCTTSAFLGFPWLRHSFITVPFSRGLCETVRIVSLASSAPTSFLVSLCVRRNENHRERSSCKSLRM